MENDNWIGEHNRRLGVSIMFRLRKIIKQAKSEYFDIIVADTEPIGRVLVFREKDSYTIQSAEFYDFYDEMLTHIPMAAHPNPRRVLIVGGGDGIVLREVLKYPSVERVMLIEVDPTVVDISKKYLRLDSGGFDDPRLEIVFCDAAEKVANLDEKFDVVIGDNVKVGKGTRMFNTVLFNGVFIEGYGYIENAIIADRAYIGKWVRIESGAILGDEVVVSDCIHIAPNTVVLPFKELTFSVEETNKVIL